MAVHWCPKCSTPYTAAEVAQGVCPDCNVPVEPPIAQRHAAPAPVRSDAPAPRRGVPFLLGLFAGCLIGPATVWSALLIGTPPTTDEDGRTATSRAASKEQEADDRARRAEAGRRAAEVSRAEAAEALVEIETRLEVESLEATETLEEAKRQTRQAETARDEAGKALEEAKQQAKAAGEQKADAERKLRDAVAHLAEERGHRATLEKALAERGKLPTKPTRSTVRDWQLLGPFASKDDKAHDTVYPPEREPVQIGKAYDGFGGQVKWRPYHGTEDKLDLTAFFKYREAGAAYAVSWAFSDADRDVTLGVGSDDGIRLWVNGNKVHDVKGGRQSRPDQDLVKVRLKKGWNEIRAKVDNIKGTWELYLSFRTADGRQPLPTLTTSSPQPR